MCPRNGSNSQPQDGESNLNRTNHTPERLKVGELLFTSEIYQDNQPRSDLMGGNCSESSGTVHPSGISLASNLPPSASPISIPQSSGGLSEPPKSLTEPSLSRTSPTRRRRRRRRHVASSRSARDRKEATDPTVSQTTSSRRSSLDKMFEDLFEHIRSPPAPLSFRQPQRMNASSARREVRPSSVSSSHAPTVGLSLRHQLRYDAPPNLSSDEQNVRLQGMENEHVPTIEREYDAQIREREIMNRDTTRQEERLGDLYNQLDDVRVGHGLEEATRHQRDQVRNVRGHDSVENNVRQRWREEQARMMETYQAADLVRQPRENAVRLNMRRRERLTNNEVERERGRIISQHNSVRSGKSRGPTTHSPPQSTGRGVSPPENSFVPVREANQYQGGVTRSLGERGEDAMMEEDLNNASGEPEPPTAAERQRSLSRARRALLRHLAERRAAERRATELRDLTALLERPLQECNICYEVKNLAEIIILDCGHHYCLNDLRMLFEAALQLRNPFKCCGEFVPIGLERLIPCLSQTFRDNYRDFFRSICSAETDEATQWALDRRSSAAKEEERTNDQMTMDLAGESGWRQCPACRNMIEKTKGCQTMRCRCGTSFQYNSTPITRRRGSSTSIERIQGAEVL